jgi:hypothetical protein
MISPLYHAPGHKRDASAKRGQAKADASWRERMQNRCEQKIGIQGNTQRQNQ